MPHHSNEKANQSRTRNVLDWIISGRRVKESWLPRPLSRRLSHESLERRELLAADFQLVETLLPDAEGPQVGAEFGHAVAASSDYRVVGAPEANIDGLSEAGVAYVYDNNNNNNNTLVATLNDPNPESDQGFGYAVSVSGDTVVVE